MKSEPINTCPKNADAFFVALRSESLCVSFRKLRLKGAEGSFQGCGTLRRDGEEFVLECTPEEGEQIPEIPQKEQYSPDDWWSVSGTTLSNLQLSMGGVFSHQLTLGTTYENHDTNTEYAVFSLTPQWVHVDRTDHVPDEKLYQVIKDPERVKTIIELRKAKGIGRFRAEVANTKLRFQNGVSIYADVHPYFVKPAQRKIFDCLHGETGGYTYSVRQAGENLEICVDTNGKRKSNSQQNRRFFDAFLDAFSFLQGDEIRTCRLSFERNGIQSPDEFKAHFSLKSGAPRPCAGAYEFADQDDLAIRILETAIAYFFRRNDFVVKEVRRFHWQLREAFSDSSYQLYSTLHLCAILEGLSKVILKSRGKWTKNRLKSTSAMKRFEATCTVLGIPWKDQFEKVASAWKTPRNALAHGDLFSEPGEHGKFRARDWVGGGIVALILADMGWPDPITFDCLEASSHLFYKGTDGVVYRSSSVSHC